MLYFFASSAHFSETATAEATGDVTAEATSDVTSEETPEDTLEVTVEVPPLDVTLELTSELTSEVTSDVTSEVCTDVTGLTSRLTYLFFHKKIFEASNLLKAEAACSMVEAKATVPATRVITATMRRFSFS